MADQGATKGVFIPENSKLPGPSLDRMVDAGMITEEIWGVGRKTGKFYKLGESGDEMVIPWNQNMLSGMNRIGVGGMIGARQQQGGSVGAFTGVSGAKYQRAKDLLSAARERSEGMADRPTMGKYTDDRGVTSRTLEAQYHRDRGAQKAWDAQKATVGQLEGLLDTYREATGMSLSETQAASSGGAMLSPTNNNAITINVSGVDNADTIISQIGPALLKFLQENEARTGIK